MHQLMLCAYEISSRMYQEKLQDFKQQLLNLNNGMYFNNQCIQLVSEEYLFLV